MSRLLPGPTELGPGIRRAPGSFLAPRLGRLGLATIVVCAGYYAGGVVGIALMFPSSSIAILWPPNAILLSALLLTPARRWWLFLLAVIPTHLHLVTHFQPGVPVVTMFLQVGSNIVQTVIAAVAVRRFCGAPPRFETLQRMTSFTISAAIAAPAVVALLVALLFLLTGWTADYWRTWRLRFFANVFAILTITPLIVLTVAGGSRLVRSAPMRRYGEFALLMVGLFAIGIPIFGQEPAAPGSYPALLYAPLPLLLWAAVRFGPGGLCFSLLVVALLSLSNAIAGRGPFTTRSPTENVLSLQTFWMAVSLPLMFLAALVEERRQAEEVLRESQRRYTLATAAGGVCVWDLRPETREIHIDPVFYTFLGYERPGEEASHRWLELVHPADRERVRSHLDTIAPVDQDPAVPEIEFRVFDSVGSERWFATRGKVLRHTGDEPSRVTGTVMEITARKQAEETLLAGQERLAMAHEAGRVAAFDWFPVANLTVGSRDFEALYGFPPGGYDATYETWIQRIHAEDRPRVQAELQRTLVTGALSVEFRVLWPDGSIHWLHARGMAHRDSDGRAVRVVGINIDVTERKRSDEALRKAQVDLARAARVTAMGQLVASIAHEVNQPLSAIITNARTGLRWLAGGLLDPKELHDVLQDVADDGNRASEVIHRIRGLLQNSPVRPAPLGVNDVIREVLALARGELARHRVTLRTELADGLPSVQGDRIQLQQVILNLIVNGVEAMSDVDGLPRELTLRSENGDPGEILVAVRDSGGGLEPKDVDRIFEAFYTTKAEGMGMGLSICRSIVEAHGGRLWAAPNDGPGATFQFTLPVGNGEGPS